MTNSYAFGEYIKQNKLFRFTPQSNREKRKLTIFMVLQSPLRQSASHTNLSERGGGEGGGGEERCRQTGEG